MADPTLADVLAAIEKLSQQNEKESAANAAKTTAEADKIRDEVARSAAGAQTALDAARADLNAKQLANAEKVASLVKAGVPDVASLQRNGVTFAQGRVLRQAEATSLALTEAAEQAAAGVVAAMKARATTIHLTSDPHLLQNCVAHRLLTAELEVVTTKLRTATQQAKEGLPQSEFATAESLDPLTGMAVAAGVTGAALNQVLSLFEVETSALQDQSSIPAQSVHAAVAATLLQAGLTVRHLTLRVVDPDGTPLLIKVRELMTVQADAAAAVAALQAAEADAKAVDPKDPALIAKLAGFRTDLEALSVLAKAFLTRITTQTADADSPLTSAMAVAPLLADPKPFVLVITGADAEASQLVVARRLLAPRVATSVGVSFDYFLVQGEDLKAAGRAHGAHAFHGKVTGNPTQWSTLDALPSTPTPAPAVGAEVDAYGRAG